MDTGLGLFIATLGLVVATTIYAVATWRLNRATNRQVSLLNIQMYFSMLRGKPSHLVNESTKKFYWLCENRFEKLLKKVDGSFKSWIYSHSLRSDSKEELDKMEISLDVHQQFESAGIPLSNECSVKVREMGNIWLIVDKGQKFLVRKHDDISKGMINVYKKV